MLVVCVLDEWSTSLYSFYLGHQHRVTSLWLLTRAFELMLLEPVLLEAPLGAVLYWLVQALWAGKERDELLVKVFAGISVVVRRVVDAVLLLLPDMLQRAFVVAALAHVNQAVTRWSRDLLHINAAHVSEF